MFAWHMLFLFSVLTVTVWTASSGACCVSWPFQRFQSRQLVMFTAPLCWHQSSCLSHSCGGFVYMLTIICSRACLRMDRIARLLNFPLGRLFALPVSGVCLLLDWSRTLGTCLHADSQACTPLHTCQPDKATAHPALLCVNKLNTTLYTHTYTTLHTQTNQKTTQIWLYT